MSKNNSHKSDVNVSCDILFFILVRLSVKSLLRFRSVSISWSDIISDRKFKKAHINQSKALGRINFLLLNLINDEFKFINLDRNRVISIEGQQAPLKGFEYFRIACSHDGLVLLQHNEDNYYKTFILWNPSTRQCVKLASCPYMNISTLSHGHEMSYDPQCYGLCYDPTTDDCKVILIYKSCYFVYSTRTFWTKKTTLPRATNNSWSYLCEGIATGGCVYWSMLPSYGINSTIICFDLKSDELKELLVSTFVSNFVDDYNVHYFCLITFKDRLCFYDIHYNTQKNDELEMDMWIMEDDGWKLLMKLPKIISKYCKLKCILCCAENDEIIFHGPTKRHISVYDPKQQKVVKEFILNYNIGYEYDNPYTVENLRKLISINPKCWDVQCLKLASCPHAALPRGNKMCYKPQGHGLCYDSTTDDCKVILIYRLFYLVNSTRNFWNGKTILPQLSINLWSSYLYE
ncbi:hypothetical protein H5410_048935 [Solanum commersonii]|uniref:F-box domain-containing protein n=1 Tax=Solanum commersonii TaxID=4109 RepID=A0A9J5XKZ2_SOLCO|nr:hypothetical protein H5410_048935 [Solanum commersonii]